MTAYVESTVSSSDRPKSDTGKVDAGKTDLGKSDLGKAETARPNDYTQLIERLCHSKSVLAVIGSGKGATSVCEGIALQLAHMGRRVVLVSVHNLLQSHPITLPAPGTFAPGAAKNIWLWPSPSGTQAESFHFRGPEGKETWLDALRRNFDSVLLDTPTLSATAIAGMADSAVLVVEASSTPKHQILLAQRALQLSGVKLAGCVLINAR